MKPATGAAVGIALGLEQEFNVPGVGGLIAYRPNLPLDGELVGEESESGQVNPGGFVQRGLPGPKGGELDFGHPLQAAHLLEFYEHFLLAVTKVTLEAGPPAVYKYTFLPDVTLDPTSFWGLLDKPPVDRGWVYGVRFGEMSAEIGDNVEIPVRLKGAVSHGTRMGAAVADVANLGTYTKGPHLRGILKTPASGKIHVRVTQVAGAVQFKVHQTNGVPAFPGAAVNVVYDAETGLALWQNLQDQAGLDLGIFDENKDPLEIIFPGLAADHADLAVGDTWTFDVPGWAAPAISAIAGAQRFTSAHWEARTRAIGAGAWVTRPMRSGSWAIVNELEADRGNTSKYAFGQLQQGELAPTIKLTRAFANRVLADLQERHDRFELQLAFLGRQLGTGAFRESIVHTYDSVGITEGSRPASEAGTIEEEVTLAAETNDAGDPPIQVEVITTRNWTPTA